MAELKSREELERELIAILIAIIGGESVGFLTSERLTPSYFRDRLRERGADRLFDRIGSESRDGFLAEVGADPERDRSPVDDHIRRTADQKLWEVADRMAKRAREWADERRQAENRGEKPPPKADLFTEADVERESITTITDTATDVELTTREYVRIREGIEVRTVWITEADAKVCPICEPLHKKPESVWRAKFPKGPPAHPRCRCELKSRRIARP